jgi:hypothetical protein
VASKEELSEQLILTQKLSAMTEQMARSVERVEAAYSTQITAIEKLTRAIEQLKSQDLGALNNTDLSGLQKEVMKTEKQASTLSNRLKDTAKDLSKKIPTSAIVAGSALAGLHQGFRNVVNLSKGFLGFVGNAAKGISSIALSILTIPFKMFTALVDMAAESAGGSNELAEAIENLRKEMGDLKGPGTSAVLTATQTLKGFSDTGLSAWRVFGTMAERLQKVTAVAVAMGSTFGRLTNEFKQNGGALLAFQKGLGVSDEQMKSLGDRAITLGVPMTKVFMEMTKQTLELGKAFEIDQKLIGKDMAKAFQDVKHFGQLTVKEIATASVYARKLGVELDKIVGTLDAFETFDSAAESAAKLSQSFGVQVDAFKLMEAQNPADQLDMLRKSFKNAGVDASQFSRQQLKLLQMTTGLDEATAKQVFSLKNQGASLDQIKKKSETAEKKSLTQAEAMSKLADSIERMVKSGGAMSGGFFEMFFKGILAGFRTSKEFQTLMINIRKALWGVYQIGFKLGHLLPKLVPGLGEFLGGWNDLFKPSKWTGLFKGISDIAKQYLLDGPQSFAKMMDKLKNLFTGFFSSEGGSSRQILSGFKKLFRFLASTATEGIKWIAQNIGKGLDVITELITNPGKFKAAAAAGKGGAAGALGFMAETLLPLFDALGNAAKLLAPKLLILVVEIAKKIKKYLLSPEFIKIIKPAIPAIAGLLFGPAFARAALGGLVSVVTKGLFSGGGLKTLSGLFKTGLGRVLGGAGAVAAVIGASMSIGKSIKELRDNISGEFDKSTRTIAAGATGIVDAITLGLLPDDLKLPIANFIAKMSDMFFEQLGNVFGSKFSKSVKEYLSAQLDVVGEIGNVFTALFKGDEDAFLDAMIALGEKLLVMFDKGVDFFLKRLPTLAMNISIKIFGFITKALIKAASRAVEGLKEKIGGFFTDAILGSVSQILKFTPQITDAINAAVSKITGDVGKKAKPHKFAEKTHDLTSSIKERLNEKKKSLEEEKSQPVLDAETTSSNIESVQALQKKLSDKSVDLKKTIDDVKSKLAGISFDVISDEKATQLEKAAEVSKKIAEFSISMNDSFQEIGKLPASIKAATTAIKGDGLKPALEAVSQMVKLANDLDTMLASGMKIDTPVKLKKMATAVGLGAKANYTVTNKMVQLTVNLNVTMDAGEVEKVVIMRKSSIIRERLNFALESPADKASPPIPDSFQAGPLPLTRTTG